MKPCEITYDRNQPAAQWLRWLTVIQGILFIAMFGLGYYENDLNLFHYIMLCSGIVFISIVLFFYKQILFNHCRAVLSDRGIRYRKKWNDEQMVDWSHISALKLTNDALVLGFTDGTEQELKFPWLNYGQRQKVKQQIEEYAEAKNIGYHYKF